MTDVDFLSYQDALHIHKRQLERYGGGVGLRDQGLLESAIETPRSGFGDTYFHAFPFEMAAAYLFHIVNNHPFVDGNKRTGLACAHAFLQLNGYRLTLGQQLYQIVIDVATNQLSKDELADILERNAVLVQK